MVAQVRIVRGGLRMFGTLQDCDGNVFRALMLIRKHQISTQYIFFFNFTCS